MLAFFHQFGKDLRFGVRSYLRTPALSGLALLSLALGIGATTAIFSAIYSVIIDPFPYADSKHLLAIGIQQEGASGPNIGFTANQFLELRRHATAFESVAGSIWSDVVLTGQGEPERLDASYSSANLFHVFGTPPLLGRGFAEGDELPGAPAVVVLSYKCWQRSFGSDPSVLGKEIRINDQVRTIVGVMPERVYWLEADVYLPANFETDAAVKGSPYVLLLTRLKKGVTQAQGEANLQALFSDMARQAPEQFPGRWKAKLQSFPEAFPSTIQKELWMLLAAVGLLLLIACANVSSLMLSKASARQKEIAIRSSLGASRGRLMQQLLTESLMLALAGGVFGMLFAWQGLRFLLSIVPPNTIPIEAKISLNIPVLLFSLAIAVAVSLLAGLAPALHAGRGQLAQSLRENTRGSGGSRGQAAVREGLVVGEVALSLALLVAAALMLRTLFALQHVPLGMSVDHVLTLNAPLPVTRYKTTGEGVLAVTQILRAIRQTPGVTAASINTVVHPFENFQAPVQVAGESARDARNVMIQQTDEQYFTVLGIRPVAGRLWNEADVAGPRRLAIVNQSFVRRYFPGGRSLGESVRMPFLDQVAGDAPFQVIGVVADVLNLGLAKAPMPEIYVPYTFAGAGRRFAIRTAGDPAAAARAVTASIRQVDSGLPVTDVMTLDALMGRRLLSLSRFQLILFGIFASIGLALAIAGIYGVVSNSVERRTRELGVRLALGARGGQVIGLVLRSGMRLVLIGIAVGLVCALLVAGFLASNVFGVPALDPVSFAVVAVTLGMVGAVACLWPACRAARIDPIRSLRQE